MFVPFKTASRRRGRSPRLAIPLTVAFGLAGIYVNLPPSRPAGVNPPGSSEWKKCPNPECATAVQPKSDGHCDCPKCGMKFEAADADDYS